MGLDVYTHWYDNHAQTKEREEKYHEKSEEIWHEVGKGKKYEEMTQEEKDEASKREAEMAKGLGLDPEFGEDKTHSKQIRLNSKKHPKHYFKIGYFRSSYNEGGFNRVVDNACGISLNDLFPTSGEEDFVPDWKQSLQLAIDGREKYIEALGGAGGKYSVFHLNPFSLGTPQTNGITNERSALQMFLSKVEEVKKSKEEAKKKNPKAKLFPMTEFGCNLGDFFLGKKPMKVRGIMHGSALGGRSVGIYVIYETPNNKEVPEDNWYTKAFDIVIETCEFVLSKPDPEKYYLHWSG